MAWQWPARPRQHFLDQEHAKGVDEMAAAAAREEQDERERSLRSLSDEWSFAVRWANRTAPHVIVYALSPQGQRTDLLGGGAGVRVRTIGVDPSHPAFATYLGLARVWLVGFSVLAVERPGPWHVRRTKAGWRLVQGSSRPILFDRPISVEEALIAQQAALEAAEAQRRMAEADLVRRQRR